MFRMTSIRLVALALVCSFGCRAERPALPYPPQKGPPAPPAGQPAEGEHATVVAGDPPEDPEGGGDAATPSSSDLAGGGEAVAPAEPAMEGGANSGVTNGVSEGGVAVSAESDAEPVADADPPSHGSASRPPPDPPAPDVDPSAAVPDPPENLPDVADRGGGASPAEGDESIVESAEQPEGADASMVSDAREADEEAAVEPASDERKAAEEAAAEALRQALQELAEDGKSTEQQGASEAVDHSAFDRILRDAVRDERVDYAKIEREYTDELDAYLAAMARVDPETLPRPERLAYYINVYNATMIRAVIDRLRSRPDWTPAADGFRVFDEPLVALKAGRVSLNHLEHEIIRKEFRDPRVHVALVCAARSCPPLLDRAYRGDDLDQVLDANMRSFLTSGFRNRIDRRARKLYLSQIFEWYAEDFGGKDALAGYVDRYVDSDVAGFEVEFIPYLWDLNSASGS